MISYLLNVSTFMVLVAFLVVLVLGSARGLWSKGYMAGLEACRVRSSR